MIGTKTEFSKVVQITFPDADWFHQVFTVGISRVVADSFLHEGAGFGPKLLTALVESIIHRLVERCSVRILDWDGRVARGVVVAQEEVVEAVGDGPGPDELVGGPVLDSHHLQSSLSILPFTRL